MKKKKTFQITANEGDVFIRLKSNKLVQLIFLGHEWGRHDSPQARIKRGWSHELQEGF